MHCDHLHTMIPLERYRDIVAALVRESDSQGDDFWLRFAAQVAVLCPDPPATIATRIRRIAESLADHAAWHQSLALPIRFVVAAFLLQHHIPVKDFHAEHRRTSALFGEVGLRHSGFYEIMAVLILHLSAMHHPLTMLEAERLKAIYDQMKKFHWWLTGPSDLPACAALAQCPGSADMVVGLAENIYQQLHDAGLNKGKHLQTAAHLLPLTGVSPDIAVMRYLGLAHGIELITGPLGPDHYDAVAVLSLLDQTPEVVIERLEGARKELDLSHPEQEGAASFVIAADLTFLDLVRFERGMETIRNASRMEVMLRTLHTFHIASAVLVSQVKFEPLSAIGGV